MGLTSICTDGYQVGNCRCTREHRPLRVVPCPPGHSHRGAPMDVDGKALKKPEGVMIRTADGAICQRCQEWHRLAEFRGGVCFFCADALAEVHIDGHTPDVDERPKGAL